jgi:hypothetical protein
VKVGEGVSVGVEVGVSVGVEVGVLVGVGEGVIVGVSVGVGVLDAFTSPAWEAMDNSGPAKKALMNDPVAGETRAVEITHSNPMMRIHQWKLTCFLRAVNGLRAAGDGSF